MEEPAVVEAVAADIRAPGRLFIDDAVIYIPSNQYFSNI